MLQRIAARILRRSTGPSDAFPALPTTPCRSIEEFERFMLQNSAEWGARAAREASIACSDGPFTVPGWCVVCRAHTEFEVGYNHCFVGPDGGRVPNWREHLTCRGCGLNNRMRAAFHFLLQGAGARGTLYLTEQVTPLFRAVSAAVPRTTGSEFLRDGTRPGALDAQGRRHEDLASLSFADRSFDRIGCFEVLEHMPDHLPALRQIRRCLVPGGTLLLTVPFALDRVGHVERAKLGADGTVEHILPAEYHGDPLDGAGVLCFRHFGWALLAELDAAGFEEPALHFYWSSELGHLGGPQFIVAARRPR